jgi:hypothetical protein
MKYEFVNEENAFKLYAESKKIKLEGRLVPFRGENRELDIIKKGIGNIKFNKDCVKIDITGFVYANSAGIKLISKMLRCVKTNKVMLKVDKDDNFHTIVIKSAIAVNENIRKINLY